MERPFRILGVQQIAAASNGSYSHAPDWYHNFLYKEERERGLDCVNLCSGMQRIHTPEEYIDVADVAVGEEAKRSLPVRWLVIWRASIVCVSSSSRSARVDFP